MHVTITMTCMTMHIVITVTCMLPEHSCYMHPVTVMLHYRHHKRACYMQQIITRELSACLGEMEPLTDQTTQAIQDA